MTLKDLTDPAAVHQALDLFDRMGREDFLAEYGFGPAKSYWLLRDGRSYDSKAIAGVAHLIQTGTLLERNQFTGGLHGAAKTLMDLGFDITPQNNASETTRGGAAFEVLWNPNNYKWDEEEFQGIQNQIQAGASVPLSWSIGTRRQGIAPGDRIYMFHVGSENRGLIGSGHATSEIFMLPHWDEERPNEAPYVEVSWDALLNPEDLLPWKTIRDHVPEFPKVFMSGGASASNQHTLKPSKTYGRTTSNSLRWDLPNRVPDNRLKKGISIIWRSAAAINDVSEHCFWRITMPNALSAA